MVADGPEDDGDGVVPAVGVAPRRPDGLDVGGRLADHLAPDERVRVCWTVRREGAAGSRRNADGRVASPERVDADDRATASEPRGWTAYAVTDRRLLAVEDGGRVRETPFGERSGGDPTLAIVAGAIAAVLSFLGGVVAASGWTALLLVVTCVGGLALAERGWKQRRAVADPWERAETAVVSAAMAGVPVGERDRGGDEDDVTVLDRAAVRVVTENVGGTPVRSAVEGDDD